MTPQLKELCKLSIRIDRGVKQGCPLSPLLFALAYDPLLHKLGQHKATTGGENNGYLSDDNSTIIRGEKGQNNDISNCNNSNSSNNSSNSCNSGINSNNSKCNNISIINKNSSKSEVSSNRMILSRRRRRREKTREGVTRTSPTSSTKQNHNYATTRPQNCSPLNNPTIKPTLHTLSTHANNGISQSTTALLLHEKRPLKRTILDPKINKKKRMLFPLFIKTHLKKPILSSLATHIETNLTTL